GFHMIDWALEARLRDIASDPRATGVLILEHGPERIARRSNGLSPTKADHARDVLGRCLRLDALILRLEVDLRTALEIEGEREPIFPAMLSR
ncbi:MAG: hypothetical protein JSV80_00545, partial [Acidobacteriota bacterium]